MDLARAASDYLGEYLERLGRAVEILPPGDTWWRPHAQALSVGTVLLHLEGNVRQWILSGIGGAPDLRERAAEFAAGHGPTAADLLEPLRATVDAARERIRSLTAADLERVYGIQGNDVRGWEAVLHVVEHFSWHTGQVVWIAKARAGEDHGLAFFDDEQVNRARNPGR